MNQLDTLKRALQVFGPPDPESPVALAMVEVLKSTASVKEWENEVGDPSECECEQCVAAVTLAHAIITEMEGRENDR